ncbi:MAG: glycosyltransferase [Rikenellaceae bacterium]
MKSLFSNWDKEQLYCASQGNESNAVHFKSFYKLGSDEIKARFPFSLFMKFVNKSGIIKGEENNVNIHEKRYKSKSLKWVVYDKYLNPILKQLKVYHYRIKYSSSDNLNTWINEIKPDVIYAIVGNREECRLIEEVLENYDSAKVILHFLDDWMSSKHKETLFPKHYKTQTNKVLNRLFSYSHVNLSISKQMSEEYARRYGYTFTPFHNPFDENTFNKVTKTNIIRKHKIITYLGRIDKDNIDVINDIIQAVNNLVSEGNKLHFNIYTNANAKQSFVDMYIQKSENVNIYDFVPHDEIANLLINKSDILLLPNSFNKKSIEYVKYSISTKLTEYLASGTPVLTYAPNNIAISEFCIENDCATVLSERNIKLLKQTILNIMEQNPDVTDKAKRGKELIFQNYTKESICRKFDSIITTF